MPVSVLPLLICLTLSLAVSCFAQGDKPDETAIFARSVVSEGNTARLQAALAKARRGEPVVVSVIGGSITGGAMASNADHIYGNLIAKWWRDTFPKTKVDFVNAGIGATGSLIGAHRAQLDLLSHKPDLVVCEFAVNDPNDQTNAEGLEGLIRQILKQPNKPAVMLLFTMNNAGGNAEEWQTKLGKHYGLPMVSYRDALWPEIQAKRMKWEDVGADMVHPNDRGHKYCADFVTAVIAKVLGAMPAADADLPPIPPTPAPLISDLYEHATALNAERITPTKNDGFDPSTQWPFGKCWESTKPGSVLEFEVEGTAIALSFWRIKKDMGKAEAQVDNLPPVTMDAWFDQTWGGYDTWQPVARDLAPGKHILRIRVLDEKDAGSTGNRFQLCAIFEAGL